MLATTLDRELRVRPWTARLPLEAIYDDCAYRRAIEILDRLFLLRREKNREEMEYFRALAQLAYDYECRTA